MENSRARQWEDSREIYTPDQVAAVLQECGVEVREETENDFLSFCPYHGNHDSPAFSTSKTYGVSVCFNPACAASASLDRLVRDLKKVSHIEAKRLIMLKKNNSVPFAKRFDSVSKEPEELPEFPQSAIDKMYDRFWETPAAVDYMKGRGFEEETLRFFKVGFTPETRYPAAVSKPDMIVVPAYDARSKPIGLVGRGLHVKEFKNFGPGEHGRGFHKSKIAWNIQNARKFETVIICESTFDAMRIHQAGYPNVIALLGGSLSIVQEELLKRHFTRVIIMTDNETGNDIVYHRSCNKCRKKGLELCEGHKPGRDLGMQIAERLPNMRIKWASFDDNDIYPHGAKDATDMTDDEIRQCLRNAVSHYEYLSWMVA